MTLELAKEILRIDTDYEDNRIQAIVNILPQYIHDRTGYPIDKQADEPLCQLAEQFLIRRFYLPDEAYGYIDRTIDSLLISIAIKADSTVGGSSTVVGDFVEGHIPIFSSDGKLVDSGAKITGQAEFEALLRDSGL